MTDAMVNLVVELQNGQFGEDRYAKAAGAIEDAGFSLERVTPGSGEFLAWLDDEFGGTWSSEAYAASSVVAMRGRRFAGFASYDPRGLRFAWLNGLGRAPQVGIFGPFGVASEFRGSGIGPHLLIAALASLAHLGYARALIPAVGHEKLIAYYERHCAAVIAETFDKALWRRPLHRAVVLASGNGSNFQAVVDGARANRLPLRIAALISNNAAAYALQRARDAGIHAVALPWDRTAQSRGQYDAALFDLVRREEPDLVLLLGWMHLLEHRFISSLPETINIHPAFLPLDPLADEVTYPDGSTTPAFRGARAVADALAWGSRWVGASCHRVMPQADRGPILVRKPLALADGETQEAIVERLHPLEHRVLAGGIMRWAYEASA